jgi:hypothetical protein
MEDPWKTTRTMTTTPVPPLPFQECPAIRPHHRHMRQRTSIAVAAVAVNVNPRREANKRGHRKSLGFENRSIAWPPAAAALLRRGPWRHDAALSVSIRPIGTAGWLWCLRSNERPDGLFRSVASRWCNRPSIPSHGHMAFAPREYNITDTKQSSTSQARLISCCLPSQLVYSSDWYCRAEIP